MSIEWDQWPPRKWQAPSQAREVRRYCRLHFIKNSAFFLLNVHPSCNMNMCCQCFLNNYTKWHQEIWTGVSCEDAVNFSNIFLIHKVQKLQLWRVSFDVSIKHIYSKVRPESCQLCQLSLCIFKVNYLCIWLDSAWFQFGPDNRFRDYC